jgi:predicted RNA methylase
MVERALEAAADAPTEDRIRDAVETVIDISEIDPEATRAALWSLRSNRDALERLEACLNMCAGAATLALGAAIQLAGDELASSDPDLRSRAPELLNWLEGAW